MQIKTSLIKNNRAAEHLASRCACEGVGKQACSYTAGDSESTLTIPIKITQ